MQNHVIPTKTVDEIITVEFSFQKDMLPGEIVATVDMIIAVVAGVDPNPRRILRRSPIIVPPDSLCVVQHKIYSGLPGVVYSITCRATGSMGSVCEDMGLLGITRGEDLYPPFIANYRSTTLYPSYHQDFSNFSAVPLGGDLYRELWIEYLYDANNFNAYPRSGYLREPYVVFQFSENNLFSATPVDGILRSIQVQFNYLGEACQFGAMVLSGVMKTILITNNYSGEACQFSAAPLTGVLS